MNLRACTRIAVLISLVPVCIAPGESSLTIYNQNFAIVRERLPLDLKAGTNEVRVTDVTAHLEPDSVILRDPQGKQSLRILEQNYWADPVSQGLLLSLYEGKEIGFLVPRSGGEYETVRGRIVRSGYVPHQSGMQRYDQEYRAAQMARASGASGQPIIEIDGELRFSLPGQPVFPSLANDAILKPTVHWLLETDQTVRFDGEFSYVTRGMSWEADYSILARGDQDMVDVIGWVTMDNQSGRTFENARIKLMAGTVSKTETGEVARPAYVSAAGWAGGGTGQSGTGTAFDEYHLYPLNRATTLRDRETKQVEFLRAEGVQSQRLYIYDGLGADQDRSRGGYSDLRHDRDYGTQCNPKIWVMKEFRNCEDNRLGVPLPRGRVRFYRRDDDSQLEFTGANLIDHTPRDEIVRLYAGDAFDLVGERRRTDYQLNTDRPMPPNVGHGNWLDESFEIKLRNRKQEGAVEVRVVEHLYRWSNWEIVEKSHTFLKTDSQTIEFRVQVPAGEEKVITYKAHYTW